MRFFFLLLFPAMLLAQNPYAEVDLLFKNKQFKKAKLRMMDYVKEHPNDIKAIEYLGDAYGNLEEWDGAIDAYKKLVDADAKNADYHYKYGGAMGLKALKVNKFKALTMIGDIKDAFTTAAELDEKHVETRWALVELYMQLPGIIGGSMDKSMKFANELQAISKVDGYLAKGYIYEYDDNPERAEKYYKSAIQVGGSLNCYEKLTHLYENEKEPLKAIANIEEAKVKHERNALHYQIGKVAAEYNIALDKGETCLVTYIKNYSVADGVPLAWARYRLAQIYKYKGDKAEALKNINLAINDLPKIKSFKSEKEKILKL